MGKKHGIQFDLIDHLAIHTKVLKDRDWLIKSGDREYKVEKIDHTTHLEFVHEAKFVTNNGYYVEILKRTISSSENPPRSGITSWFSYDCFKEESKDRILHYHSPHSKIFNANAPWHDKHPRHYFDGAIQKVDVYSFDHRPKSDHLKKYTWDGGSIKLTFLGHEDWPFISQFLDEVSEL